jgi:tetratricopeptide (TPR) repeat protein
MKKIVLITVLLVSALYSKATMSQKNYEMLMKAQEHIEKNELKEAKTILNTLLKETKSEYTKAYTYQSLANIALAQGNYTKTKEYYENIIKLSVFEKENIDKLKFSLSKIHLSMEEYEKSIAYSNELLKDSQIGKKDIYETLIYAYYYTKKYKKSISYAKEFFKIEKRGKENIYQILYSSYVELKEYKNAIAVLEDMVQIWTKNQTYWLQLVSLYQEVKQYKIALNTLELAYKKDILDPTKHTMFFVNLLVQNDLYNKAALVIKEGLAKGYIKENKNVFELLVMSYLNSKEKNKAIDILKTSEFAKNIKYQKILANLYYTKQEYEKSIKVLENLKLHSHTKEGGDLYILLAINYYELNNMKQCKDTLKKVLNNNYTKKKALRIAKQLNLDLNS